MRLLSIGAFARATRLTPKALLAGLLAEHLPGVRYAPPQASFLAWLDCRDLGLGDDPGPCSRRRATSRWAAARASARRGTGSPGSPWAPRPS